MSLVIDSKEMSLVKKDEGPSFESQTKLRQNILLDIIGAIEMCSVSFELGVVFKHYGYWCFAIILYLNIFYQCLRWPYIQPPCPYFHIVNFVSGKSKQSLFHVFMRCIILTASGLSAYHLVSTQIWKVEMIENHIGRIKETSSEQCQIPGNGQTPLCLLILSEFLGVFILDVTIKLGVVHNQFFQKRSRVISAAIIPGIVVLGVSLAMNLSGGMFNPMLATVLLGGCDGQSLLEHVGIYWIASTFGAILGDLMVSKIYQYGNAVSNKTKKKTN